jgi:SAM-dependent methyltransferase
VFNAEVTCAGCDFSYEIRDGILRLLPGQQPLDSVVRDEQEVRDERADGYETHFSNWENDTELGAILSDPALMREKRVLDLACGTGRFTRSLAVLASATMAADLSEKSLRILASKISPKAKLGLIWGDAVQLSFAHASFDVILSTQLLEHIPLREKRISLLRSAHSHLRPSGAFLLTVYYYSLLREILLRKQEGFHAGGIFYHRFTASEIRNELGAGFRVIETRPLLPDPRVLRWLSGLGTRTTSGVQASILAHLVGQLLFIRAQRAGSVIGTMESADVA